MQLIVFRLIYQYRNQSLNTLIFLFTFIALINSLIQFIHYTNVTKIHINPFHSERLSSANGVGWVQ